MIIKENVLIIGSAGRNCGKTEFACKLISSISENRPVVAVKITTIKKSGESCPRGGQGCGVCSSLSVPYQLIIETNRNTHKDTSRMLRAGANLVYWLRVHEESLFQGVNELLRSIPDDTVVVCESNSLRLAVVPGLFIILRDPRENEIKISCRQVYRLADKIILFDGKTWNLPPDRINFTDKRWILREKASAIILAGGKSIRMGEDKSLLQVNGKPLISKIANQLFPNFNEVIIGSNEKEKFKFLNLKIVPDIEKDRGPLMGLLSSLKSSSSDLNFVTACDVPHMYMPFIRLLLSLSADNDIVIPVTGKNRFETLFAVYSKSIIPVAEELLKNGKSRITELFSRVRVTYVEMGNNEWYLNLNTKQNYLDFLENRIFHVPLYNFDSISSRLS